MHVRVMCFAFECVCCACEGDCVLCIESHVLCMLKLMPSLHNRVQECRDAYNKLNGVMQFGTKLKLTPLDIEGEF